MQTSEFVKAVRGHSHVKEGIASTLKELDQFEANNKGKAGDQFYDMVLEAAQVMRKGSRHTQATSLPSPS